MMSQITQNITASLLWEWRSVSLELSTTAHAVLRQLHPLHSSCAAPGLNREVSFKGIAVVCLLIAYQAAQWISPPQGLEDIDSFTDGHEKCSTRTLDVCSELREAFSREAQVLTRGIGLSPPRRLMDIHRQHGPIRGSVLQAP